MVNIYGLIDPRTREIRYVGKTNKAIQHRLRDHCLPADLIENTHKNNWIKELFAENLDPEVVLLSRCEDDEWVVTEQQWIELFPNLTNMTPGGDGVRKFTQDMKDRIAKAHAKVIYQYSLSGEYIRSWSSTGEAARAMRVYHGAISAAASRNCRKKTSAGYQWSRTLEDRLTYYPGKHTSQLAVLRKQNDEIKIFSSVKSAAGWMGMNKGTLSWLLQCGTYENSKFIFKRVTYKGQQLLTTQQLDNMLDFLKSVSLDETVIKAAARGAGGHRKEWSPTTPLSIRVWKDGSVFPSQDLVERFDLEYGDKPLAKSIDPAETEAVQAKWVQPGSAFDVFDSKDFPVFKTPRRLILANVVPKAQGKSDLFSSVGWGEDGKILNSVMTQGSNTFGKSDLLPMLKEVYGIELNDENPHVDLIVIGQDGEKAMKHFAIEKGFCFVPKKYSRGKEKGKDTVVRREDPWLFILLPLAEVHPELIAKKEARLSVQDGVKVPGAEPDTQN